MSFFSESNMLNGIDAGLASEHFKRAVLRNPPRRYVVEFLPIERLNTAYVHGMRICPLYSGSTSASTLGDRGYDIWRRWDDCLWFFEHLHTKYKEAAREKRVRLQQGKGVKGFNGVYKQDFASSWESLPPGPDPNSVSADLTGILPRLSNKGTIFRPSRNTVEARHKEFQRLVEILFSDEMPALVKEIRESPVVTDFFGLWRRDSDLVAKNNNRNSLTYSVFSSYFSASNPSLASGQSSLPFPSSSAGSSIVASHGSRPERRERRRERTTTGGSDISRSTRTTRRRSAESDITTTSTNSTSTYNPRRTSATSISSSDSGGSNDSNDTLPTPSSPTSDSPIIHSHPGPAYGPGPDRPSSILEVLPEEREMLSNAPEKFLSRPSSQLTNYSTPDKRMNRVRQVIGTSPKSRSQSPLSNSPDEREEEQLPVHRPVRDSWQSALSVSTVDTTTEYLDGLNISLPNKIREQKFRASMASISTFMTTDSMEAVIPKTPTERGGRSMSFSSALNSRRSALTLSDFDIQSDDEDDNVAFNLDDFPRPVSLAPAAVERPETPTPRTSRSDFPNSPDSYHTSFSDVASSNSTFELPPSPTSSTISGAYTTISETSFSSSFSATTNTTSPTSGSSESINLKVVHNDAIIMLKVSRSASYDELRQKIYNKFVGQEGVPLSGDFVVAQVLAAPIKIPGSPVTPTTPTSMNNGSVQRGSVRMIKNENDWERLVMTSGAAKVSLRIMDL